MTRMKVTLQASLKRGTLYWVAEVNADSEDEAIIAAENLFLSQIESDEEWEFDDFQVEG